MTTQHSPQSSQFPALSNKSAPRSRTLAGQRLWKRQRQAEKDHAYNCDGKLVDAMDWLFDRGIVFDILPNDKTATKIAKSDIRTQTLACLTYLEQEPDQENLPLWQILIPVLVTAGGFGAANIFNSLSVGIAVGAFGLALLFLVLLITSKINRHTKQIAAWASSWSIAIRESTPPATNQQNSQPAANQQNSQAATHQQNSQAATHQQNSQAAAGS